ncbi:hypothetical protein M0722_16275 [Microbacterium sp. KSW4-16]|uniref:hypothetical protein n=1 Tax=Microbacterium aurugineum TaxID=2851642 RepID=UPI0020BF54A5|nr:hypothetical protein [Microbacterium aurugineum]MCK8468752.1 hypothetical protein [Microbacterium aurugineum]
MTVVQEEETSTAGRAHRPERADSTVPQGFWRWIVGGVLAVFGVVMLLCESVIREWETRAATVVADVTFASDTMFAWSEGTPTVGFTMGEGWCAAQATVLAGAGYLAGAVALIGGLLVLLGGEGGGGGSSPGRAR